MVTVNLINTPSLIFYFYFFRTICSQCHQLSYCSRDCQTKDWPIHKLICSSLATLDKLSLPDKTAKLGFYFPESGKKAELIWVLISETGEPVFDEHLNMRQTQKFACGVATIVLRKDFRSDQSKVNKCIQVRTILSFDFRVEICYVKTSRNT